MTAGTECVSNHSLPCLHVTALLHGFWNVLFIFHKFVNINCILLEIENLLLNISVAEDTVQWTDRLYVNWSRWIWPSLPSKACTIWYCCLQRTWCAKTWRSVCKNCSGLIELHIQAVLDNTCISLWCKYNTTFNITSITWAVRFSRLENCHSCPLIGGRFL